MTPRESLKTAIRQLGLTRDLADALGISVHTIYAWTENNCSPIPLEYIGAIVRLADHPDVRLETLRPDMADIFEIIRREVLDTVRRSLNPGPRDYQKADEQIAA